MSLDRFAARASSDPAYFGYHLRDYATAHCLTNAALAAWLGVAPDVLTRIRICGTPRDRADCEEIAGKLGGDVGRMCEVMGW
ncbi:MAG: hypothetical protein E6Q76_02195 [Rhizobium sp.]|nr:MAG: hypothetical protein E6Q76_02195 [Rhizobium sp.]